MIPSFVAGYFVANQGVLWLLTLALDLSLTLLR
jgi:hypothetical protein